MTTERVPGGDFLVLFADDDEAMRAIVRDALEGFGLRVALACDGRQALELLAACEPDVIITDLHMPFGGLDLVAGLHRRAPSIPIIVVSSLVNASVSLESRARGATELLMKPVRMAVLALAVRRLAAGASV
jgi:CheY-like chemotaxis protein